MKKLQNLFISLYFFFNFNDPSLCWFLFIWITKSWFLKKKNIFLLVFSLYMLCLSLGKVVQQWIFVIVYLYIYIYIYIASKFFCSNHKWLVLLNYFRTDYGPPKADIPTDLPSTSWVYNHLPPKNQKKANHFLLLV